MHERVEFAQREHRDEGDEDERAVGPEKPQRESDDDPERDCAEDTFAHAESVVSGGRRVL